MDQKNNRKGKEKNVKKDKSTYKYGNKRVRQYEALLSKKPKEKDDKNKIETK
tara:strand:- start:376 stop:531 length:156 start_codon:yes stop_codon:yes gene_type:complete